MAIYEGFRQIVASRYCNKTFHKELLKDLVSTYHILDLSVDLLHSASFDLGLIQHLWYGTVYVSLMHNKIHSVEAKHR